MPERQERKERKEKKEREERGTAGRCAWRIKSVLQGGSRFIPYVRNNYYGRPPTLQYVCIIQE